MPSCAAARCSTERARKDAVRKKRSKSGWCNDGTDPPVLLDEGGCQVFLDAPFATADNETAAVAYERAYGREGCAWRPRPHLKFFSLLQRSCLASALTRQPVTARRLGVFASHGPPEPGRHSPRRPRSALPPNPGARWPPFPGAAPAVAAIPPDNVDRHHLHGVKRTAFDRQREPNRGGRPPQPPPPPITMPLPADARAGAISETRRPGVCLGQAPRSTAQSASPRRR